MRRWRGFHEQPRLIEAMPNANHAMSVGAVSWQLVKHFHPGPKASRALKGDNIVLLKMGDAIKFDASCQSHCLPRSIEFQPGATWDCLHGSGAACGDLGEQAREQTFVLDIEGMTNPETPPLRVLERPSSRKLH